MPRTNGQCQDDLLFMQILGLVSPYTGGHFDIDVFWGHFFGVDQAQVRCVISSPAPGHDVATHAAACAGCCHPLTRAETLWTNQRPGQTAADQSETRQLSSPCSPCLLSLPTSPLPSPIFVLSIQPLSVCISLISAVTAWPRYHSRPSNDRWLGTKSPISGHNLLSPDHLIS